MKMRFVKTAALVASLIPALASASHWSYDGAESPGHWAEINSEFKTCQQGKNQSPINIDHALAAHVAPLKLNYTEGPATLLNNGHTIQASFNHNNTNTFTLNDTTWTLEQFHFHAPSENTINGKHYPMEMHLVHSSKDGDVAVVAVMFEIGKKNEGLAELWKKLPTSVDKSNALTHHINMDSLVPEDTTYWRFSGSLTTPPCTEGVTWLVMKHPLTLSEQQLQQFKSVMHHDNNRPIQPLHGRVVVE